MNTKSILTKTAVTVGIAAAVIATGGVGANAATIQKIGGGSFSGLSATGANHTFTVGPGGAAVVTCTGASFSAISGTGAIGAGASFAPSYSGCIINISGIVCNVDVKPTPPGRWTVTATGGSSPWIASVTIANNVTITVNDDGCGLDNCVIIAPAGGPYTGGSIINDLAAPAGIRIRGSISGINWSALPSCGIGSTGSNGIYTIPTPGVKVPGVQVV